MLSDPEARKIDAIASAARLTAREIDIIELLAVGYTYKFICNCFEIKPRTLHVHVTNIRRKLIYSGLLPMNSRLSLTEVLAGLATLAMETVVVSGGSKEKA